MANKTTGLLDLPIELIFKIFDECPTEDLFQVRNENDELGKIVTEYAKAHPLKSQNAGWNRTWKLAIEEEVAEAINCLVDNVTYEIYLGTDEYEQDMLEHYVESRPDGFWETFMRWS